MAYQFPRDHLRPEQQCVDLLLASLNWDQIRSARVTQKTRDLLTQLRATKGAATDIETFLQHYPLTSNEGLSLMTLSEALLRIPDNATADALIAEKMASADWSSLGGENFLLKAAGMGLSLAQKTLGSFADGLARPMIRKAMSETVRRLGKQFVVGSTIKDAMSTAISEEKTGYRLSFDMLGEGARTKDDAAKYFAAYAQAIETVGNQKDVGRTLTKRHGISVKLSALHPRYHWTQEATCVPELTDLLLQLCVMAKKANITLTVDAEESDRLEMFVDVVAAVSSKVELQNWNGLGVAIQAYDKRCFALIDDLADMARKDNRILQVRLVKGAYWDGEIKRAQLAGWADYAVFTRKKHTDLSYLACAQKLLQNRNVLYPMFAGHNAQTVVSLIDMIGAEDSGFEFQRLYGMGKALGDWLCAQKFPVTIYGPVGAYEDLLPYLVRRMLENGANTSFVAKIRDPSIPIADLAIDPVMVLRHSQQRGSSLPLPPAIYGASRSNSQGHDLSNSFMREEFEEQIRSVTLATPPVTSIDDMFLDGLMAYPGWKAQSSSDRAAILRKAADMLELNTGSFIPLLQGEGKKTLADAIAEIREAVDFCRYYAAEGETLFASKGQTLPGPTGEKNILRLMGRGVFVCISPWNFPLAIFIGQVAAALMAGNSVIAKPAEQTPQIAQLAVQLLHQAGVPQQVLQIAIGDGKVGAELVQHASVGGVAFTGSTDVARLINRALAAKDGPIVPLIAETGGQNAMIVDSSALPEQVVDDVVLSAFGSAGQRCSALRVLYVQNEIANRVIDLLKGSMALLRVGDPRAIATDVGPVIDDEALGNLQAHKEYLNTFATKIAEAPRRLDLQGTYCAPIAYEIGSINQLKGEVFGPILHVIRYAANDLDKVIADINGVGFGLTFGLHSRLMGRFDAMADQIHAGNIYINRSIIGAVVGVQPFGGQGLSGTGPKAGGPHYLARFATEQAVSTNIVATGGNVDLISQVVD